MALAITWNARYGKTYSIMTDNIKFQCIDEVLSASNIMLLKLIPKLEVNPMNSKKDGHCIIPPKEFNAKTVTLPKVFGSKWVITMRNRPIPIILAA